MVRVQIILFAIVAIVALAGAGLLFYASGRLASGGDDAAAVTDIGGPFELTDQAGHRRTDKDFRGRYMLLYFGYTSCPDVCPTTLQSMSDAFAKLGAKADRIVPVFITLDPERDTPDVLRRYVHAFGSDFVGLTGNLSAITKVAHAYRVYFAKHAIAGGGYSVDHSSTIYLVGPDGKLVTFYDAGTSSAELASELETHIS